MIYLDHNATTLIHPEVKQLKFSLMDNMYNPSSIHNYGRRAKGIIEHARRQIGELLKIDNKARDYQIIFTSSGTEANNLIISNFVDADIFISAIEHLSILNQAKFFSNIKLIKVDKNGIIDLEDLAKLLKASQNKKKLVSVMMANNETGVIQPIKEVSEIAKEYGTLMHSDLAQALGKIHIDINELGIDFATISGHKVGAGFGAAALIAKTKYFLKPLIIGGGQERGIRAGSEDVPAIAGFGLAAEIINTELNRRIATMKALQEKLENTLPLTVKIIAKDSMRLPNTSLIVTPGFSAETQLIAFDLRGVAVSSGSACSSGKVQASHVLKAMGIEENEAKSAIRISMSHYNSEDDIDNFTKIFDEIYKIRKIA